MIVGIIGAGMAGLLAANMMRQFEVTIYEKQDGLPNNHSAVLRFRSSIVGDVLGVPFKKVTMVKSSVPWRNSIADALAYSHKCFDIYRSDRSLPTSVTTEERFIAPPDLINRMSQGINFRFGAEIHSQALKLNGQLKSSQAIISTIPMPVLMQLLDYKKPFDCHFLYQEGVNIRATIDKCDAYVSLYIPDPAISFSRISLSGNELIIELQGKDHNPDDHDAMDDYVYQASHFLGIQNQNVTSVKATKQKYAKIVPISDEVRKDFMYWATDKFNIYSLGRYATWRPKLLLDDLVQDVRKIAGWAMRNDRYGAAKERV